jgi:hypothetical protein
MKKQTEVISFLTVLCFLLVIWLPCQAADDVIYACKNNKTGKPRFVSSPSQCKTNTEHLVTLNGTSQQQQNMTLQCVTAELYYTVSASLNYCQDPSSLTITNPYPSSTNPTDIFEVFCESPSSLGDDVITWGLRCKEGWVNTGCTGTSFTGTGDLDIPQFLNGCYSDDEEYGNANIFTTCCRITAQ